MASISICLGLGAFAISFAICSSRSFSFWSAFCFLRSLLASAFSLADSFGSSVLLEVVVVVGVGSDGCDGVEGVVSVDVSAIADSSS